MFSVYEFGIGEATKDLYFYGVKKWRWAKSKPRSAR
jgi:hypothetical protein